MNYSTSNDYNINNKISFSRKIFPHLKQELDKFKYHLEEASNEMVPLKVWQFQELSLQAAERIMTSPKEEALRVLINIAHNFPMQVRFPL